MSIDHSIWTCAFTRGKLPVDFVGGCPVCSNQGFVEVPMAYTVVTSAPGAARRRNIMIDTGFESGISMSGKPFEGIEQHDRVLGKIGMSPADIDTVVLTHLHFDHAGAFDKFPNARILVQRSEYDRWKEEIALVPPGLRDKQNWKLSSMDMEAFERFDRAVEAGRIDFLDGDAEIAEGVSCRLARDSHTFGIQWVEVTTPEGPYVIASDCVYCYANIERMWPPGYGQGNNWNLIKTYERIRDLVGEERLSRVIPGHDMQIFERHKSWTVGAHPVAEIRLAQGEASRRPE